MKKRKRLPKRILILPLFALVLVAGIFVLNRNDRTDNIQPTTAKNPAVQHSAKTYRAASEGSTFDVPEDVPRESIKNYTLVTENEQFKIRKDDNDYVITLYAIINRPDQYDAYKDQLREYKQNALQYLTDQGVNIEGLHITYEPKEATQL